MADENDRPSPNQDHAIVSETSPGTVMQNLNATEQHLEIEVEDDLDSAFGGSDQSSASTSLASSVFNYVYEVGLSSRCEYLKMMLTIGYTER
jgi:hypothetical protein